MKKSFEIIFLIAAIAGIISLCWAIITYFVPKPNIFEPTLIATPTPRPTNTPPLSPTPTFTSIPSPSTTVSPLSPNSNSSLIPKGQRPVMNDPLNNNSEGYGWDEGTFSGGNCNFVPGQQYVLTSSANSKGVGCNTENPRGSFRNFVYQIKMTIREGIDDGVAGEAGPTFRVIDNGPEYQVNFDVNGYWSVVYNFISLAHAASPFPYFLSGVNQSNFITIRALGNSIQVQVNGYTLDSFTNNDDAAGFIGVEMTPGSDRGKAAFSDVRVWQL